MAITRIGTAVGGNNTTTSFTLAVPGAAATNDYALIVWINGGATVNMTFSGGAGGWTAVGTPGGSGTMRAGVHAKFLAAGDLGATITVSGATNSSTGVMLVLRSVDQTTPIDAGPMAAVAATGNVVVSGITTTMANALVVGLIGVDDNITTSAVAGTDPATYVLDAEKLNAGGVDTGAAIFSEFRTTAGATGNVTFTNAAAIDKWATIVAIRPGSSTITGTAVGAFTFSSTSVGQRTVLGLGVAAYSLSATATGRRESPWSAVASATTDSSTTEVFGTALGAFSFTATGTGEKTVSGTAASSFAFNSTALGVAEKLGTATATFAFNATAAGTRIVTGQAVGTYLFNATASGEVAGTVSGTALGAYSFSATATGTPTKSGQALSEFTFSNTALGTRTVAGQAVSSFVFETTALGVPIVVGQAVGTYDLTATALGVSTKLGQAVSNIVFVAHANGFILGPEVIGVIITGFASASPQGATASAVRQGTAAGPNVSGGAIAKPQGSTKVLEGV